MKKTIRTAPPKAYNNAEFLNSPDARTIRILSEFLEPRKRFRDEHISDTIVFFGSARIKSPEVAQESLKQFRLSLKNKKRLDKSLLGKYQALKNAAEMSKYYRDAERLTFLLTNWTNSFDKKRHFVVCSGGGPGIMEAANKGARKAGGKSIGLNISLPFEQSPNPYITPGLSFEFHYFFMRKFWFIYLAKALVMFPGGFGTFDEVFEVLTLLQTKKVIKPLPVVLYGRKYWNTVINFDAMVKMGTISDADMKLIKFFDTPEETFAYLQKELTRIYAKEHK
jgi:uncharacterized protein (TIGR00730 family)